MSEDKIKEFYTGGFFYNPKTSSVLLHLRDNRTPIHPNKWAFFGGKNEGHETPKQCFIREIEEELTVKLRMQDLKNLCSYFNEDRNIWRYIFYVESELSKESMKLTEGADFDWIALDEVFEYDLTEKTRKDLRVFLDIIGYKK